MELSRATIKKLMALIGFAALCFAVCQRLEAVGSAVGFVIAMLSPFLSGAALAFVLNVPMRSIETKLFSSPKVQRRLSASLRRGISLLLTFVLLALVVALLVLVIAPQLASTIAGLGATIQNFFTRTIAWGQAEFANNPQLLEWLNTLTIDWKAIDWNGILNKVVNFLKNGAGDVLSSTISVAKSGYRHR